MVELRRLKVVLGTEPNVSMNTLLNEVFDVTKRVMVNYNCDEPPVSQQVQRSATEFVGNG